MVTIPALMDESPRRAMTLASSLRRVVSFPIFLAALLVAGAFSGAKPNILDPDTWWHIAVGQRILQTHAWPQTDVYSWTVSGTPWIAYEWLGEVGMGAAASIGGMWSATMLLVALAAILTILIYYYASLRCGDCKAAFVAAVTLLPILVPFFTLRPQLMGAIFLVITLIVLEKFRRGNARALWILPPLFLCWVNTHGSFVFGFLALGVTWLAGQTEFSAGGIFAERWTRSQSLQLLVSIFFCVLILPVTPYGTRVAAYPLTMALGQPVNVNNIQEWQPVGTQLMLGKFFLVVVLLFFLVSLLQQPRFRLAEVALALFGVYAACVHLRFIMLFVILLAPLWALMLSRWVPAYRREIDHPWINAALMSAIAIGMIFFFPSRRDLGERVAKDYPMGAVQYLTQHPVQGRVLNEYGWGGFLIWAGAPRNLIFIDGRADIYEFEGVLSDYLSIVRLEPKAFQLLNKYDVQACLIPIDGPLNTALSAVPGWERVFHDQVAAVYIRKTAAPGQSEAPTDHKAAPRIVGGEVNAIRNKENVFLNTNGHSRLGPTAFSSAQLIDLTGSYLQAR
ncbi:MAG: hypothetical protein LAO19_03840 [Acidobacteriia bacterium]|nr:hypothetical protein [Terriglobia bacterium]